MSPTRRPTMVAVAEAAGVSVATVDRVLNSRLPVKERTAVRVIEAAQRLGYHGADLMRQRVLGGAKGPARTLGFILQMHHDAFYQPLGEALCQAAAAETRWRCQAVVRMVDALQPEAMADAMRDLARQADGIGVVAGDHPHVNQAVADLKAAGCPTVALLSDIGSPLRAGYVGLDHRKTGRTAGWAISRLSRQPGEVAVLVGSHRFIGQELAEMSLRSYLRERAPDFRVLDAVVSREEEAMAYEATLALIDRHPDLVGLHLPSGGVAGVVRALRETRSHDHHIVSVAAELSPVHRAALLDGVLDLVIATPRQAVAQAAVQLLCEALDAHGQSWTPRAMDLPFDLFSPENV
ncbi:LacI family DNA-binding transcriptional regulator [uncultured Aquabacterium sp.]|uniref:LacI family DNA-binding transcriptional regulator n=1 Tax=Aquabacterium sp. TaxID=1872578 RepID=UPI0025E51736|nr:LacI family DNA-binding transcriptional regulator [uncultured Aquabacterium sp.]